jgi:hypothetical protein
MFASLVLYDSYVRRRSIENGYRFAQLIFDVAGFPIAGFLKPTPDRPTVISQGNRHLEVSWRCFQ